MRMILSEPTQQSIIQARKYAEIDYRSQLSSERREGRAELIQRMKSLGVPVETIARMTGLTEAEIQKV